jgi:predicted dienelactone hydrolase
MRKLMLSMLALAIVQPMSSVAGFAQTPGDATALGSGVAAGDVRVGHSVKQLIVGEPNESRPVDVHLWYPADSTGFSEAPQTFYASRLYGEPLIAGMWDPLSWKIEAQIARENVAIDPSGRPFPVIVFSHGATNDPIDYAYTLELIAAAGFVVAAPTHVNNSQDDVRIDFVNAQAASLRLPPVLACRDGRPSPCARTDVPRSMADRARDISSVLDALPGWYGDRVDVSRAGIIGHSRGTVTALVAAGGSVPAGGTTGCGSAPWNIAAEPRIKAVMGLAIGAAPITSCVTFANVTVPVLLMAGTLDGTSPPAISKAAYDQVGSTEKAFVAVPNAMHRSFDSTYCAQMQAAGAVALDNPRAILDTQTVDGIVFHLSSGVAMDYCSLASFTNPINIQSLVTSLTALRNAPKGGFDFSAQPVPRTNLETDDVKQWVNTRAMAFFGRALDRTPPVVAYSTSGTLGTGGWYLSDVAVSWIVTDAESDITSSTGCNPTSVTADTRGDAFTCTASSTGGSSTLQTPFIKRDATAPTITYAGNAGTYGVTDIVSITCTPDDNLSGVPTSRCDPVSGDAYTFAAGVNTFTRTATDNAGNVGAGAVTFSLEVTPSGLCELTRMFLRSSTAHETPTPAHSAAADALTATTCARVSQITSSLTPAKKAPVRHRPAAAVLVGPIRLK